MALDPSDPGTLYAALYARQRQPWSFASGPDATDGKDLGGIFKSTDGGATWKKLSNGLPGSTGTHRPRDPPQEPEDRLRHRPVERGRDERDRRRHQSRRRGLPFRRRRRDLGAPKQPEPAPLLLLARFAWTPRTPSASTSWASRSTFRRTAERRSAKTASRRSTRTSTRSRSTRARPERLLLGTDGGAYQSFDAAKTWEHLNRYAAGQFYRINLDDSDPYRICGGLQDNLNWVGPSATRTKEGILNTDWINIEGGDGFSCVFDPEDPQIVYAESQEGDLHRFDLRSGAVKKLRPSPPEGQPAYRFHWNSPLIGSRHEKGAMYFAGNRVFKLTARGEKWTVISPDLSTQDPKKTTATGSGAENFGVVYTLAESPLQKGLLWAGTDDGKVWVTSDEGASWTDLTANLPPAARGLLDGAHRGLRARSARPPTSPSRPTAPGRLEALAYRTADLGRTWQSIAGDLPADGPVKIVREDPRNPQLLFAGTEHGLFASLDRGASWTKLGGLPTVAVDDIAIHPRERDLVVATHGRSLYVLDDITALEELTPEVRAKDAHLFPPLPAHAFQPLPGFGDWNGARRLPRRESEARGAPDLVGPGLHRRARSRSRSRTPSASPWRSCRSPATPGLGRIVWDLKPSKELLTEYGGEGPKFVRAGDYKVTLSVGKVEVRADPRVSVAPGLETR